MFGNNKINIKSIAKQCKSQNDAWDKCLYKLRRNKFSLVNLLHVS